MGYATIRPLASMAVLLSALGLASAPAGASVISTGCDTIGDTRFGTACSLAELVAGGTITINDKLFANFTLAPLGGSPRPIDAAVIRVDPIDVLTNPGLTLIDTDGTLRAENGDTTQNDFGFDVNIVAGNLRMFGFSAAMAVGEVSGDDSFTSIFETVLSQDFVDVYGNTLLVCDTLAPGCANSTLSDSGSFDPVTALSVIGGIDLFTSAGGVAQIESITVRFAQVPIPGSLALLGLGLCTLAYTRVRR
jgi:hypothetical protein